MLVQFGLMMLVQLALMILVLLGLTMFVQLLLCVAVGTWLTVTELVVAVAVAVVVVVVVVVVVDVHADCTAVAADGVRPAPITEDVEEEGVAEEPRSPPPHPPVLIRYSRKSWKKRSAADTPLCSQKSSQQQAEVVPGTPPILMVGEVCICLALLRLSFEVAICCRSSIKKKKT